MAFLRFPLRPKNELEPGGRDTAPIQADESEPTRTCSNCRKAIPLSRLWANQNVCPCGHHFRLGARQRITLLTDRGSFRERDGNLTAWDPLTFPGYLHKLETARISSRESDAILCGTAAIEGHTCAIFAMEPDFMMGSMGAVVGEKLTRLFESALAQRMPVIGFTVSGGARMQEGLLSLMQMAKVSGAVKRHSDAGLLYIPVLTDPTTGGVTASFAMEGDLILAEPGATIGFAGARVIEQTAGRSLPKGFQTAEFLLEHGFVDAIVPRLRQRETLAFLLALHDEKGACL